MALLDELAVLLYRSERAVGAPSIAAFGGATHLCIFIADLETGKFLPAPGFPQTLPSGREWHRFLRLVAAEQNAQAMLVSPYSFLRERVSGFVLNETAMVALFGNDIKPDARTTLTAPLRIVAALLIQENHADQAEARAVLSNESALESQQLAVALRQAHEKLAGALTAREALLQEIRTKDERLQMALRAPGIGVWELDRATDTVYLAPEAAATYGYPSKEVRALFDDLMARVEEEDRDRIRNAMASARNDGAGFHLRYRIRWPDGVVRFVEDRSVVLREADGQISKIIGLLIDNTQRALSEEALVRAEKLAAAGRLAASIAHEINNPLEGLVNLIYIARREPEPERVQALLEQVDHELARLSSIARQTLGFYRESNSPARFSICDCIQQILDLYAKQFATAGVVVRPKLSCTAGLVEGWPGEIKQAVSNLLINAVHASERGQQIRLRVKEVCGHIQLTIADGGHGISRNHLNRIFEPFFSKKKDSGTGLGLWVTKQIVEKHGGSIRVRSSTDAMRHGTVFLLKIPVARAVSLCTLQIDMTSAIWHH